MAANAFRPHLLIVPEDDANLQIVNGFLLGMRGSSRSVQLEPPAGGWVKVIERFEAEIEPTLARYPERLVLLLIDCDGDLTRLDAVRQRVRQDFADRVFALGAGTEPEDLRKDLGAYEKIGGVVATQCEEGIGEVWDHELLRHNIPEVKRLRAAAGGLLGFRA